MATHNDRLIYLIFMAQNRLRLQVRDALAAAGVRITLVQAGILFLLQEKPARTMSEISQLLTLDNSTVTGLIDRLEKFGFVERKANPKDRRVALINMTPQGRDEADNAAAVVNRINDAIKSDFSKQEIQAFKKILNSFVAKAKNK